MPRDPDRPLEARTDRWLFRLANRRNSVLRVLALVAAVFFVGLLVSYLVG